MAVVVAHVPVVEAVAVHVPVVEVVVDAEAAVVGAAAVAAVDAREMER